MGCLDNPEAEQPRPSKADERLERREPITGRLVGAYGAFELASSLTPRQRPTSPSSRFHLLVEWALTARTTASSSTAASASRYTSPGRDVGVSSDAPASIGARCAAYMPPPTQGRPCHPTIGGRRDPRGAAGHGGVREQSIWVPDREAVPVPDDDGAQNCPLVTHLARTISNPSSILSTQSRFGVDPHYAQVLPQRPFGINPTYDRRGEVNASDAVGQRLRPGCHQSLTLSQPPERYSR